MTKAKTTARKPATQAAAAIVQDFTDFIPANAFDAFGFGATVADAVPMQLMPLAPKQPPKQPVAVRQSQGVEKPTKMVHAIAEEMGLDARRIDVIRACEAKGIATNTAKTQYQIWYKAAKAQAAAA